MFDTLKLVFDTFGKDLMVPVMIFIICMIFKAPAKKAFSSAVLVGVGLKGMTFITTEFGAVLSPLVQQLIATTGLNLKALDIGWQAVASVAYSTDIGMMFIGVGLLFQIILWLVKWTDIFMPSDLWNNYSIIVWGSMFFAIKENLAVAFVLMLTDYSRKTLKKSKYGADREFIVSVNDALGYGETATLTTGLLVIPVCVLLAFILPGNVVVPLMVLPSLPYMVEVPVCLSNGNVIKSWIMACIVFSAKILMASYWAGTFTEIAAGAGFEAATQALEGGTLIIGFIMSNCTAGLITMAFLTMNPVIIIAVVAIYFVLYVLFRKNKSSVREYIEKIALGDKYVAPVAPEAAASGQ